MFRRRRTTPQFDSYSQSGEDAIVAYIFRTLGVKRPFYIDLGAWKPTDLSNTYAFYQQGGSGICVEANPELCKAFMQVRPRDKVLNRVVSAEEGGSMPFFVIDPSTVSTSDPAEAERLTSELGYRIERTVDVPAIRPADVLDMAGRPVDLLSIDLEMDVLPMVDDIVRHRHRPLVLCVETITHAPDLIGGQKEDAVVTAVSHAGYTLYADTWINSIFVDEAAVRERQNGGS